jgi:hypothetical protein
VQKPPRMGRKTVPGPSRGGTGGEGEETSGSENETRLVATGPLAARRGVRGCASLEAADGNDLVPGPDSDGEGAAQDGVGAVVERPKGWDDAAPTHPDEEGGKEVAWQLIQQLDARTVPRQRNGRNMQGF